METWKTIDRRTVFSHSRMSVEIHTVGLPNGETISSWPWVITADHVTILAMTEEGRFLFFRQPKYAIDGISLAPVGGYIEQDEDPLLAAQRELLEETGYEAADWTNLGNYCLDANRGVCHAHLFLARGAHPVSEPLESDLEEQELLQISRSDMETALMDGQFKVLGWTTLVALALQHLKE